MTPVEIAWERFSAAYLAPFHQQPHPECAFAGVLLDLVAEATFESDTLEPGTVHKDELFRRFVEPIEEDDGSQVVRTRDEAESALAYLIEKQMVVVDGDIVSAHPRFTHLLSLPDDQLRQTDARTADELS